MGPPHWKRSFVLRLTGNKEKRDAFYRTQHPQQAVPLLSIEQVWRERQKGAQLFLLQPLNGLSEEEAEVFGINRISHNTPLELEEPIHPQDVLEEPLADRLRAKFPDPNDEPWIKLFSEFPDLAPDKLPPVDNLPPGVQHSIELTENTKPKSSALYQCSGPELAEMKRQLLELLAAGHIRHSKSAWGAPVLFVKKPNTDKLRMCIDYRYLNMHTRKDVTPIPRVDELRQRLRGATRFSGLDLMSVTISCAFGKRTKRRPPSTPAMVTSSGW